MKITNKSHKYFFVMQIAASSLCSSSKDRWDVFSFSYSPTAILPEGQAFCAQFLPEPSEGKLFEHGMLVLPAKYFAIPLKPFD
ncbi:MAG: hypothetical protein ABH869_02010 [Candidatus Omnitrophota bacterium]